jgi:hypothetical protein
MPQARRAETGEWSALTEAKALYTDNVSDWSVTRRLALSKDLSQHCVSWFFDASTFVGLQDRLWAGLC